MPRPAFLLLPRLFPEPERLAEIGIRIGIIVVVAFLVVRALYLVAGRVEKLMIRTRDGGPGAESRIRTLGLILRRFTTTLVVGVAGIRALSVMGWDVAPLLAGAGIVGVALGFGAQSMVRDLFAGLFILAENQFSVGDVIEFAGKPSAVEALTLRCTTLRDFNGYIHYVPNGELKTVTNRSRGWTRLAVDVPVARDQNLERALEVCRRVVNAMNADPDWMPRLLDPVELWGVESLALEEAQVRMVVRTRPGEDAPEAARRLRFMAQRALSDAGVRSALSRDIRITPLAVGGAGEAALRAAAESEAATPGAPRGTSRPQAAGS